ncbi:hypothetical protein Q0M94_13595 [Deinococcus radiomollis]|uniref:hypothetical protein n=1 Tax=Deinococcus radiomollis TaxID=468916 RepID=UPI0038919D30
MNKILIGLLALTLSVASAAPKATMMKTTMITPKMTAAMCTKSGGMVKMMKGKQMCAMTTMKK